MSSPHARRHIGTHGSYSARLRAVLCFSSLPVHAVVVACLTACSSPPPSADGGDVQTDATAESGLDVPLDRGLDADPDVLMDARTDTHVDAGRDSPPPLDALDASSDATTDAPMDVSSDGPADSLVTDAAPDAMVTDVATDAPRDGTSPSCTFPPSDARIVRERIGAPTWELEGVTLFTQVLGTRMSGYSEGLAIWMRIFGVNHRFDTTRGQFVPGSSHAPPHALEIADRAAGFGYELRNCFDVREFTGPNGVFIGVNVIPAAGAPTGSTSDYGSGPLIPTVALEIDGDLFREGTLFDGAFDSVLTTPSAQSHQPLVFGTNMDFAPPGVPAAGSYEFRLRVIERPSGVGWRLRFPFTVSGGSTMCTCGASGTCAPGICPCVTASNCPAPQACVRGTCT